MARVLSGYTLPEGVNDIKAVQRQLGVTADGIWGPKTDAAYKSSQGNSFQSMVDQITAQLAAPKISYRMPSTSSLASEISAYLKPQLDQAITARQDQTLTNRAEIDADAASRGMGRSSFVTDVKDRAMDAEATDISNMESDYQSRLLQAVQEQYMQHQANKLAADQYNSSAMASARGAAYQYALAEAAKQDAKKGGRKSGYDQNVIDVADRLIQGTSSKQQAISNIGKWRSTYEATLGKSGTKKLEELIRGLS